jgi:MFS family permease
MQRSAIRSQAVLAIVLVSYTMIVLDISIVITALPKIHYALGFSVTALSWVQNAYLLTFGACCCWGPARVMSSGGGGCSSSASACSRSPRSPSAARNPRSG